MRGAVRISGHPWAPRHALRVAHARTHEDAPDRAVPTSPPPWPQRPGRKGEGRRLPCDTAPPPAAAARPPALRGQSLHLVHLPALCLSYLQKVAQAPWEEWGFQQPQTEKGAGIRKRDAEEEARRPCPDLTRQRIASLHRMRGTSRMPPQRTVTSWGAVAEATRIPSLSTVPRARRFECTAGMRPGAEHHVSHTKRGAYRPLGPLPLRAYEGARARQKCLGATVEVLVPRLRRSCGRRAYQRGHHPFLWR